MRSSASSKRSMGNHSWMAPHAPPSGSLSLRPRRGGFTGSVGDWQLPVQKNSPGCVNRRSDARSWQAGQQGPWHTPTRAARRTPWSPPRSSTQTPSPTLRGQKKRQLVSGCRRRNRATGEKKGQGRAIIKQSHRSPRAPSARSPRRISASPALSSRRTTTGTWTQAPSPSRREPSWGPRARWCPRASSGGAGRRGKADWCVTLTERGGDVMNRVARRC